MRLREIGSNLRGDFLVVLLEASQAVNRGGAGFDGLSKLGPFEKERNSSIIAERAEGAKSGVRRKPSGESAATAASSVVRAFGALRRPSACKAAARAR